MWAFVPQNENAARAVARIPFSWMEMQPGRRSLRRARAVRLSALTLGLLLGGLAFARWVVPPGRSAVTPRASTGRVEEPDASAAPVEVRLPRPARVPAGRPSLAVPEPGSGRVPEVAPEAVPDVVRVRGLVSPAPGREDPVGGIAVRLVESSGTVRGTETDVLGRFELVATSGPARWILGDPEAPLLPPEGVELLGPETFLGDRQLPALGRLEVEVVDAAGLPVPGARIDGLGEAGGAVRGTADARGRLAAVHLPAGHYRVFASDRVAGRGNRAIQLSPATPSEIRVVLRSERPPEAPLQAR